MNSPDSDSDQPPIPNGRDTLASRSRKPSGPAKPPAGDSESKSDSPSKPPPPWRWWKSPFFTIPMMILLFFSLRSSVLDWNDVPTGSMKPSIVEGDRILVNKLAYDVQIPFLNTQVIHLANPQRGDIVVFYSPDGDRLVKRVIGIPGDVISLKENVLYVNGQPMNQVSLDPSYMAQLSITERSQFKGLTENLAGHPHPIMLEANPALAPKAATYPDPKDSVTVPPNQYFMMGDNRDKSRDSRYIGMIDRSQILGRANRIMLSLDPNNMYLPRWGRFFQVLP